MAGGGAHALPLFPDRQVATNPGATGATTMFDKHKVFLELYVLARRKTHIGKIKSNAVFVGTVRDEGSVFVSRATCLAARGKNTRGPEVSFLDLTLDRIDLS